MDINKQSINSNYIFNLKMIIILLLKHNKISVMYSFNMLILYEIQQNMSLNSPKSYVNTDKCTMYLHTYLYIYMLGNWKNQNNTIFFD